MLLGDTTRFSVQETRGCERLRARNFGEEAGRGEEVAAIRRGHLEEGMTGCRGGLLVYHTPWAPSDWLTDGTVLGDMGIQDGVQ